MKGKEMTTPTETLAITLTPAIVRQLHAVSLFATTDDMTPVLESVRLYRDGGEWFAESTDRYQVAQARLKDGKTVPDCDDAPADYSVLLHAKDFQAASRALVKVSTKDVLRLKVSPAGWELSASNGQVSGGRLVNGSFPSVARLFPDTVSPIGYPSLNPAFLARINDACKRMLLKDHPVQFAGSTGYNPDTGKIGPVVANVTAEFWVLTQPNLRIGSNNEAFKNGGTYQSVTGTVTVEPVHDDAKALRTELRDVKQRLKASESLNASLVKDSKRDDDDDTGAAELQATLDMVRAELATVIAERDELQSERDELQGERDRVATELAAADTEPKVAPFAELMERVTTVAGITQKMAERVAEHMLKGNNVDDAIQYGLGTLSGKRAASLRAALA